MMIKRHLSIKLEIDSINVRNNINYFILWIIVGNKIGDKIDELTHPNESKKDRIIRKTKNDVNEVKEEANTAYGNIKEKFFNKSQMIHIIKNSEYSYNNNS